MEFSEKGACKRLKILKVYDDGGARTERFAKDYTLLQPDRM